MRTPLNAVNLVKDIDDICRAAMGSVFHPSADLENAIRTFKEQTNPLIMDLFERYTREYPDYTGIGDWRPGLYLRYCTTGVEPTPNPELQRFIDHIRLMETTPLKSYELFMSDMCTYVVFAHNKAEAIQILTDEHPDLTIQVPKSITEKDIPNKPCIFMIKSQITF